MTAISPLDVPRSPAPTHGARHRFASAVLRARGWTPEGDPPSLAKYVVVAAPHTVWDDGFLMQALAWYWDMHIDWLVKSSSFVGRGMQRFGAIPIDRSGSLGLVAQLVAQMKARDRMHLLLSPEGTRARGERWKSGFYHLAREAGVPICLGYLDYGRRRGGFGPCFVPTGNVRADMDFVRAFYSDVQAARPEHFTPPRLAEEEEA